MRFDFLDRLGTHTLQFGKRRSGSSERCHLRLNLLALLFLALDIDVPADQLAGEPDVLTFLADSQRELRILDDDFEVVVFRIDDLDARDLGRTQGFLGEGNDVFRIRNDVDFFAAQFADDGLHAHAFHAHAGAHWIDVFIAAEYGDFGALTRFARRGPNLHRAVVDLRDLHFEQALYQYGISAGDDDLRAFCGSVHGLNDHTQAVAEIVGFQARLLALRQPRFGAAHVDDDIRALETLDDAVHELAGTSVIFVKDRVALGLAHLLHDHLLGGLRGDTAKNAGGLRDQ